MPRGVKVNTKLFRKLREARGLSQAMLGEKAGLTQVSLSRIENGHPATFETIGKAADVLGIDAVYLLESQIGDVLLEGAGNGKEAQEVEAIDLSDAAGTAFMGRVEAGEVEELAEDEKTFFDQLAKYRAKPYNEDLLWSVNGYERNVAQGLAGLSRRDREEGAEAIQRVLRRMRERVEAGGAKE